MLNIYFSISFCYDFTNAVWERASDADFTTDVETIIFDDPIANFNELNNSSYYYRCK